MSLPSSHCHSYHSVPVIRAPLKSQPFMVQYMSSRHTSLSWTGSAHLCTGTVAAWEFCLGRGSYLVASSKQQSLKQQQFFATLWGVLINVIRYTYHHLCKPWMKWYTEIEDSWEHNFKYWNLLLKYLLEIVLDL